VEAANKWVNKWEIFLNFDTCMVWVTKSFYDTAGRENIIILHFAGGRLNRIESIKLFLTKL